MHDDTLISLASALALEAGAAILAIRRRGFDVVRKEDRSPVTEADHAAEAIIVAGLRAAAPNIPVIAEEEAAAGRITEPSAEFWLVDPLDGTREFAAGNNEFAVNIGLVRMAGPFSAWWRFRRPVNCSAALSDAAHRSALDRPRPRSARSCRPTKD